MSLPLKLAAAAALSLLAASPCGAVSLTPAPANTDGSAKLTDPDEAHMTPYMRQFAPAAPVREGKAEAHGAMVTYDLSSGARKAKTDGYDAIHARSSDPGVNPFLSAASETSASAR